MKAIETYQWSESNWARHRSFAWAGHNAWSSQGRMFAKSSAVTGSHSTLEAPWCVQMSQLLLSNRSPDQWHACGRFEHNAVKNIPSIFKMELDFATCNACHESIQ